MELSEILSLKVKTRSPVIVGVYFLILNEKIVYIGSSSNCHSRIKTHKSNRKMMFQEHFILPTVSREQATQTEKKYIQKFTPKHNLKHNAIAKKEENIAIKNREKRLGWINPFKCLNRVEVEEELNRINYKSQIVDTREFK